MNPLVPLGAVLGLVISCLVAQAAGRGARTWGWGVAGPPGWIVAAIIGLRDEVAGLRKEARERGVGAPRAATVATRPEPAMRPVLIACPACGKSISVVPGVLTGSCQHCGARFGGE